MIGLRWQGFGSGNDWSVCAGELISLARDFSSVVVENLNGTGDDDELASGAP